MHVIYLTLAKTKLDPKILTLRRYKDNNIKDFFHEFWQRKAFRDACRELLKCFEFPLPFG